MKFSILLPFSPGSCLWSCASNQVRRKLFLQRHGHAFLFFPRQSSKRRHKAMLKGVGKGQGKGKGKPEGKGQGKGKGKGAGVGNTYVDPGRPKIFQLSDARKTANLCIRQRSLRMCDGTCSTRMDTLSPDIPRREWIQGGLPCTLRLSWRSGG
jgi:hypothetical protein